MNFMIIKFKCPENENFTLLPGTAKISGKRAGHWIIGRQWRMASVESRRPWTHLAAVIRSEQIGMG